MNSAHINGKDPVFSNATYLLLRTILRLYNFSKTPTNAGAEEVNRTPDLLITNQFLVFS